jgi:RNA polymerase sigma-70 factor (ECF subfamily)
MRTVPSDSRSPRPNVRSVFEEHFDYIWSTLQRLGVREVDLEDLAHEVFLRVHARLDQYDPMRPIRPWLFGFAYRIAADHRRLARHRMELLVEVESIDPRPSADDAMASREQRALLRAALDAMDIESRALLVAHHVDGVAVPEIAEALGIPLNTAYSRLRLARTKLAAATNELTKQEVRRA